MPVEMQVKVALACKSLLTAFHCARVGLFSGVLSVVGLQDALFVESPVATWMRTHEISLACVSLQVDLQALDLAVGGSASSLCALEGTLCKMGLFVGLQALFRNESFIAQTTSEILECFAVDLCVL